MGIKVNGVQIAGVGAPGAPGKSAYEAAKEAGYTGTEQEFNALLYIIGAHASRHEIGGADALDLSKLAGTLPPEKGGTGQASLEALATAMGGCKIQTGSYVGTGTYGSGNPNRLTFDFEPKCLLITKYGMLMFVACLIPASYGSYSMMYYNSGFAKGALQMKQNGTEITWYSNSGSPAATWSPKYQMNDSGVTYQYIAIG